MTPEDIYERRIIRFDKLLKKLKKTENRISNLRLLLFVSGAGVAFLLLYTRNYIAFAGASLVFAILFIYLIIQHQKIIDKMKYTSLLSEINTVSLNRIKGEFSSLTDNGALDEGAEFVDENHKYAGDLDIFGENSLYQGICCAHTFKGRRILCNILSGIRGSADEIKQRQQAVTELAQKLKWRQRFQAEGMYEKENLKDPESLINWGKECNSFWIRHDIKALIRICPFLTVFLVLSGLIIKILPWHLPVSALIIQFAFLNIRSGKRQKMFSRLESYCEDLKVYYKMLSLFEKQEFDSFYLNKIKSGSKPTYRQLDKLSSIVDSISNRRNAFYFVLNVLTLWDFQCVIAFEKWRKKSGRQLNNWFDTLGEVEALASLAVLRFDYPDWTMPHITDTQKASFFAADMGHPLLKGRVVCNTVAAGQSSNVLLITGSNMSGKSTLLRTVGINLVLAYAGAPVFARELTAPLMEIYTCMRVRDDLNQNISTFYAELLRIKKIVEEASSGKRIIYLLDEIFKGTNSYDRHAGAKALINKLSTTNSVGLVSTHDLELCDMEKDNKKLSNYHFREQYENGRLSFDYKLRSGPSTTRNAVYLMRLAGIEMEDPGTN